MDSLVPNEELHHALLPSPDAHWPEIAVFAHSFDGYRTWGSFDACATIAKEAALADITDCRTTLFFAARAARHCGYDPGEEEMIQVRRGLSRLWELVPAVPVHPASRWRPVLLEAVHAIASPEAPDEIAYLALTSKPELPIRDRIAFQLTKLESCRERLVAREYRRTDLALLHHGEPELIVELKACYSFDMVTNPARYIDYVARDLTKCRETAGNECERFGLLLVTHPRVAVAPDLRTLVKYSGGINAALRASGNEQRLHERAATAARHGLQALGPVVPVGFGEGEYAGVRLQLDGWLVGPLLL
jgi:hypothetical protein